MKIGLVLPDLPVYSETFFRNKILGLQESGNQVLLFVQHPKAKSTYLNCKVVKAPKLSGNPFIVTFTVISQLIKTVLFYPSKSFKLYQLNKKDSLSFRQNLKQIIASQFLLSEQLDWLHFGFGTMALERENIAQAIGARMAVSFRGFDIGIYPIKHPRCYTSLFQKVDRIHVISDDIRQLLYKEGLHWNKQILKITPAIDVSFFEPNIPSEKEVLKLVTIARLHWKKGLETTLEALSLLKNNNIDFHFTIIGTGSELDRLQFATYQLGLSGNVTFAGKLTPKEVKKQLSNADIYLQYSIQEGFCNAVLEAQAMGLLCIVSDAEGLSENVLNNQTGFVIAKQNPILLFEKINEVIALPEIRKQAIRNQAVERIQKEFNLEKQQKDFLVFYNS